MRGSRPISTGDRPRITSDRPTEPKLSLNSDQPMMPSSVVTLRKENIRQPASAWNVSTRSIFILPPIAIPRVSSTPVAAGQGGTFFHHAIWRCGTPPLFFHCARHRRHIVLDEERIDQRHRHRTEQ